MKINSKQITWGTILTTLATIVVLWTTLNPWPVIGWTTPEQHQADFSETVGEMKAFRDEWKCDEWEEELQSLLEQQRIGDTSVKTERRIEKLHHAIDKLDCGRFEELE